MFDINYKDAGYFEIKDSRMKTDLITKLYWDGKIECIHNAVQIDWEGDKDFPHACLNDEELSDLIRIVAFTRKIRFMFSLVSTIQRGNFNSNIDDYGLIRGDGCDLG